MINRQVPVEEQPAQQSPRLYSHDTQLLAQEIQILTADNIEGEIFCAEVLYQEANTESTHPIEVLKPTADPDTMYLHEAMRERD